MTAKHLKARRENNFKETSHSVRSRESGRTLLEMVVTIAIIGIVASVATPSGDAMRHQELATAASVTADALRYAREQARLTGNYHGISVDIPQQQLSVFRLDLDTTPPSKVFDVMHPLAKQPYVIDFNLLPYKQVALTKYGGEAIGSCSEPQNYVFDTSGVVRCANPLGARFSGPFIGFESNGITMGVQIDGYSGRVFIP